MGTLLEYVSTERHKRSTTFEPSLHAPCKHCFLPKEGHYGPSVLMKASKKCSYYDMTASNGIEELYPAGVQMGALYGQPITGVSGPQSYSTYPPGVVQYLNNPRYARGFLEMRWFYATVVPLIWALPVAAESLSYWSDVAADNASVRYDHQDYGMRTRMEAMVDPELGRPLSSPAECGPLTSRFNKFTLLDVKPVSLFTELPGADYAARVQAAADLHAGARKVHNLPWMLYASPIHRAMYFWALFKHYWGYNDKRTARLVLCDATPSSTALAKVAQQADKETYHEAQVRNRGEDAFDYAAWKLLRAQGAAGSGISLSNHLSSASSNHYGFFLQAMFLCSGYTPMAVPTELEEDDDE